MYRGVFLLACSLLLYYVMAPQQWACLPTAGTAIEQQTEQQTIHCCGAHLSARKQFRRDRNAWLTTFLRGGPSLPVHA